MKLDLIRNEKGMTLLELIIVLVIMGIILIMVLPNVNSTNETLNENLFISQFDSVFQKGIKDARTVGEETFIELTDKHYMIISSKPNREVTYTYYAELNEEDIGKQIIVNRYGMVEESVDFSFKHRDKTFHIQIEPGYKNVTINGKSLAFWRKEGE